MNFHTPIIAQIAPETLVVEELAKGMNWILIIVFVVGLIRCVLTVLGVAHTGQWNEAKEKIGAQFLLMVSPALVKLVWVAISAAISSQWT